MEMSLFDYFNFGEYTLEKFSYIENIEALPSRISHADILKAEYQTKDLGQTYNGHFYLKKDPLKNAEGFYLYHHEKTYKWVDTDDELFKGHLEEVSAGEVLIDRTHTINVYELFEEEDSKTWIEFEMEFIGGLLWSIKLKDPEVRLITEDDRMHEREFHKKIQAYAAYNKTFVGKCHSVLYNAYYRGPLYLLQRWFGRAITNIGYNISNWRPL